MKMSDDKRESAVNEKGLQVAQRPEQTGIQSFSDKQIQLMKDTIAKGATDDELAFFIAVCQKTRLDPFARQIFLVPRWDKKLGREVRTPQTSIDGFRLIAERSGKYAGQVGPFWCGMDGKWVDVWLKKEPPAAARVGVLHTRFREPLWATARFDAYKQEGKSGLSPMWAKMGDIMIAKCAESLALRKAFPQEMDGLYTQEEMGQAEPVDQPGGGIPRPDVTESKPPKDVTPPPEPSAPSAPKPQVASAPAIPDWVYRAVHDAMNKRRIRVDRLKEYCRAIYGTEDVRALSPPHIKDLKVLLEAEDTDEALLRHLAGLDEPTPPDDPPPGMGVIGSRPGEPIGWTDGDQGPRQPIYAGPEPDGGEVVFDDNLDFLTDAADPAPPARPPQTKLPPPSAYASGKVKMREHAEPPPEYASQAAVDGVRELGRRNGFSDAQQAEILQRRFGHRDWSRLLPFNLKVLRTLFDLTESPKRHAPPA